MIKKTRYSLLNAWVPNYRESQRTGNNWVTNPRGQDDSYKKEKKNLRKEGDGGGATSGSLGMVAVLYSLRPTLEFLPPLIRTVVNARRMIKRNELE